ncbi:MAG: CYTH domain-containing protein [Firmicutes bacterium]|nr:CYTH domain-containing protein [Bacillota bacterium]
MEVELKYLIPNTDIIDEIWQEAVFQKYGDVDSHDQMDMKAVYYDTEDGLLSSMNVVFRVRKEGDHKVATLKWNGTQSESLHEREELSITIPDSMECDNILSIFKESEKGRELIDRINGSPLKAKLKSDFTRRTMRIDTGSSICEAALDVGKIITEAGDLDICELEIELFSGDVEDIKDIGADLAKRFKLGESAQSKYGRGMDLLKNSAK